MSGTVHRIKEYERPAFAATGKLVPNSPSTEEVRRFLGQHAAHGWMTRAASRLGRESRWVHAQAEALHPLTVDVVAESSHEMSDANALALADLCWGHRGLVVGMRPETCGDTLSAFLSALKEVGDVAQLAPVMRFEMTEAQRSEIRREALEARAAIDVLLGTL